MNRLASTAASTGLTDAELGAWSGFLRAHACLVRALDTELEAAHGLPLISYELLVTLESAPGRRMRMCDLADAVRLSRSGLTRLADRLEGEGLLERMRCPADARGAFAVLTEKGRETLEQARPTHLAGVRRAFLSRLHADEVERLGRLWERLSTPRT